METKQCKVCSEIKSPELFKKNGRWRAGICKACDSARVIQYQRDNRESVRAKNEAWAKKNPERVRELGAKARKKYRTVSAHKAKAARERYRTSEKGSAKESAYRAAYIEANRELMNAKKLAWMKVNKHKVNATNARRNAKKLQATPVWANHFFIEEAYDLAQRRTVVTGFLWSVDHIVPLISKLVCGLHAEQNLQVIPHEENRRKNNRYWPDMPIR